ncbi:MAG: tetratricopeptide repeat protein [Flavobacteriales bacterium]|nr:tetratricopeptide repeat protein [Flavobacteriales bacterium]
MKIFYLFALLLIPVLSPAQVEEDLELADYYYNQGQFEQARLYYEKIYKTNRTNRVYTNYLNTLIALDDFEEAEKLVKRRIKTDGDDGMGYVNLGELYKKFDRLEEARGNFDMAIQQFVPTRSNAVRLANEFSRINEYEYALKVYEKARTKGTDGYAYTYEVANLQGTMGNYDAMTESFLDLIIESPGYLQTVQNSFNRTLNFQENPEQMEMLKGKLLKRAQKNPEHVIYTEMLTWLFMQKKDFASALVQARSLDTRLGENGYRIIEIAQLATNNRDYATAKNAYQYVIDKGPMSEYYLTARMEKLKTAGYELAERPSADKAAYEELEHDYEATLAQVGEYAESAMMMKELAHLKAFHLGKLEEAEQLLARAIELPGVYDKILATCKLERGDILLLKGEVWDASLLYQQVELDFKEDVLGHEAKFRSAKISYYTGDFEWAQAQLDVLKASTSKLISNDAIDLSLLITDNFNMDTLTTPMEMYARADLLAYQNQVEAATATLDSLETEWPMHSLSDEIKMLKASMAFRNGRFDEAKALYEKVVDLHAMDITADDALFKLAEMHQNIFNDPAKAMELYEKLITEFPGSLYVVEARKRFRELRGDALN